MSVSASPRSASPLALASQKPTESYPLSANFSTQRRGVPSGVRNLLVVGGVEEINVQWDHPLKLGIGIEEYGISVSPSDISLVVAFPNSKASIKITSGKYTVSVVAQNYLGASPTSSSLVEVSAPPPLLPVEIPPDSLTHIIGNVTIYHQIHNLSCEETAMSMALTHQGIYLSQDQILNELGSDLRPPVRDATGFHWGDPYVSFVGNVNGHANNFTGYQANPPPLVAIAQKHGARVILSGDGISANEVYAQVALDHPTLVYATWDWQWHPRNDYIAFDGRSIPYIGPLDAHVYTVVGISPSEVLVDDPLRGQYWVSRRAFEASYGVFLQAIVFA